MKFRISLGNRKILFRDSIHFPVEVPWRHPMSGQRTYTLMNYADRVISPEAAKELQDLYNRPSRAK